MNLIHRGAMEWPGFTYTDEEKEQLSSLAAGLTSFKFGAFLFVNTVIFITLAAIVVWFGVMPMATVLDPEHKSGLIFLLCLALGAAVSLGLGLPASLAFSSMTMNAISGPVDPGPVTEEQAAALYRKMQFQITRMGLIMSFLLVPLVIVGRTELGGKIIEFVRSAIVMIAPFAVLLTVMRAMGPRFKR
jgi:hypothetical protein